MNKVLSYVLKQQQNQTIIRPWGLKLGFNKFSTNSDDPYKLMNNFIVINHKIKIRIF